MYNEFSVQVSPDTLTEYPAAHAVNNGIAVGAVNQLGQLADFSNRAGSNILDYVTAPGVDIFSSLPSNSYGTYSGTSMAAPHVAGVAALLMGHNPDLTSEQVENLLIDTASNSNQTANSQNTADYDKITNQTASPSTWTPVGRQQLLKKQRRRRRRKLHPL